MATETYIVELDKEVLRLAAALFMWVEKETESDTHRATAARALVCIDNQTESVVNSAKWINPFQTKDKVPLPQYAMAWGMGAYQLSTEDLDGML